VPYHWRKVECRSESLIIKVDSGKRLSWQEQDQADARVLPKEGTSGVTM
jgi:hypothetical protein